MNRTLKSIFVAALLATSLAACAYSKTDASSMACVYNGGWFDSRDFRGYVEPGGGRENQGWESEIIEAPVNVRQWSMKADGTGDFTGKINVNVKGVVQSYEPTLTFTLNSEIRDGKPVVCDLIEKHLRPLSATDFNDDTADSAWVNEFLNARMKPVVENVMIRILQNADPTALAQNIDGARDEAAQAVGDALGDALADQLGDQYFCKPSYQFGGGADACGEIAVVLPAPGMSAEDATLIAAPQRAKTEANNAIAVETENARKAAEVATQRQKQADSAEKLADANQKIAEQEGRVATADAANAYAWCTYLASLGQDCALVKAAEKGDYPDVVTGGETTVAVIPPTTSVPAP